MVVLKAYENRLLSIGYYIRVRGNNSPFHHLMNFLFDAQFAIAFALVT